MGSEPKEVFDAVRGRIIQGDNFTAEPQGVQGLVVLVGARLHLQRRLLGFIREVPITKWALGPLPTGEAASPMLLRGRNSKICSRAGLSK